MRSPLFLLFVLFGCFPVQAFAGNIYGSLWVDGRPAIGAQIQITCANRHAGQTDSNGSYQIFVQEKGRCVFHVDVGGHSGQTDDASYDDPIKYDFDLVLQNGNYVLRSK